MKKTALRVLYLAVLTLLGLAPRARGPENLLRGSVRDDVRDEKARELYGKPLSELPEEAQDAVRQLLPIGIFEMEMKKP